MERNEQKFMKTCKTYNGTIEAYTPTELESLKTHGAIAEQLWLEQWKYQGAEEDMDFGEFSRGLIEGRFAKQDLITKASKIVKKINK